MPRWRGSKPCLCGSVPASGAEAGNGLLSVSGPLCLVVVLDKEAAKDVSLCGALWPAWGPASPQHQSCAASVSSVGHTCANMLSQKVD